MSDTTKPIELKLGTPIAFEGDRTKVTTFLRQCTLYFTINSAIYNKDDRKVGYALALMNGGTAAPWADAFIAKALHHLD